MARRKRKDEAPAWSPPEFDEVGYMRKEIESAQVALVTIGWAAVGAVVGYAVYLFNPVAGFFAGLLTFGLLYFLLPLLGLPIDAFRRRDWLGHASIYLFSWLAFFIIILNPPFGDHTAPTVQFIAAGSYNGAIGTDPLANTTYCVAPDASGHVAVPPSGNATIYVEFRATDNVAVSKVRVTADGANVSATLVEGSPDACVHPKGNVDNLPGTYAIRLPNTKTYTIVVTATDEAGLSTTATFTVSA